MFGRVAELLELFVGQFALTDHVDEHALGRSYLVLHLADFQIWKIEYEKIGFKICFFTSLIIYARLFYPIDRKLAIKGWN